MPITNKLIQLVATLSVMLWAGSAGAVYEIYSMDSYARQRIGHVLELPITGSLGTGGVLAQDIAAGAPFPMKVWDAQLDRPATPSTAAILIGGGANGKALQLRTSLAIQVPPRSVTVSFFAGGRTGPATLSFCPAGTQIGQTVFNGTGSYNPNCTVTPSVGPTPSIPIGIGEINGWMRYTATSNQFGGFGGLAVQGTASLALIYIQIPAPTPTGPGGPGVAVFFPDDAIDASGVGDGISVKGTGSLRGGVLKQLWGYTSMGLITSTAPPTIPLGNWVSNNWGGNLTTGMITLKVTDVASGAPPQTFTISGSDTRDASGLGNISLVSGSLGFNGLSKGGATRNFIGWTVTPEPTRLAGAGGALLALLAMHRIARRRSQTLED